MISPEKTEKLLSQSSEDVILISDGLTKQHFITIDRTEKSKGILYEALLLNDYWHPVEEEKENEPENTNEQQEDLTTEISESVVHFARKRLESFFVGGDSVEKMSKTTSNNNNNEISLDYLNKNSDQIKDELIEKANVIYNQSLILFEEGNFEKALSRLRRAFNLNSFNIQYYLLKCESFLQLCDFKSALLTINKLLSIISVWADKQDPTYDELKIELLNKIAFCHYTLGITNFDCKLYVEALESFNKASDLKPNNINYRIRSITCLFALGRYNEAILILNKLINENDDDTNEYKPNLLVLRARINIKNFSLPDCYFDLKKALEIDPNHKFAKELLNQIEDTAEQLRNSSMSLSLSNRLSDALNKLNGAISMNPFKAEYNLQRGIIHKRMKNFNSAIDDFLIGLEKINNDHIKEPLLFSNFQRHILLTYNDFAIVCYEKKFYDDAIVLLNKAIKIDKNEKGFYVNRGDCFYKKGETQFAILDFEQALELDTQDQSVSKRIGKICYEMAVQAYDNKEYEEATKHFEKAIRYVPTEVKYYLSRARTYYFMEDLNNAQVDICICILLDPTNQEIPTIINRIFANQNLNDVLKSEPMNISKMYLSTLKIKNVFDLNEKQAAAESTSQQVSVKKEDKKRYIHLLPDLKDFKQEEKQSLELIEQKKNLNLFLKENSIFDLNKTKHARIAPLPIIMPKRDPNKLYEWRKFNMGLNN